MGQRLKSKNKKRARDINSAVKKGTAPARHKVAAKLAKSVRTWRLNRST